MRVLYTCTSYPPSIGGAQLHQHQLALQISLRHEPQVVTLWDSTRMDWLLGTTVRMPSQSRDYAIDGIPVRRLGLTTEEKLSIAPFVLTYYASQRPSIRAIARLLEKKIHPVAEGVDIIHNTRIGREPLSYASWHVARQLGVAFILTPLHHPRWGGWWHRYYMRLYRLADGIIALTNAERDLLVSLGVDESRITVTGVGPVLANHPAPQSFREKHRIQGPMVLFLGQKFRHKNLAQLVGSASYVWERYPQTRFVLVGPPTGYSRRLMRGVRDPRILELGTVTLQEKTDAIAACDILCLPSSQESFGGVFVEAWMMEKPVVGGDIPAVREVIADGNDGLIAQATSRDISEKILYLLDRPETAREMGERGKKKVLARYTWDRIARKTEHAYLRAVRG